MDIAIAFRDVDGGYTRHVGAMLASLFACTPRTVRVHVLHDETLTLQNRARLCALPQGPHQSLHFHTLDPRCCLAGVDENSPIMRPLTFATLYRLFLPDMPELKHCARLLYLDTDIIIDTDLGALWDKDLGSALLGAVPDPCLCGALTRKGDDPKTRWAKDVARHSLGLGIPMTRYFNAGVLLLDLAGIRKEGLFAQATELVLGQSQLLHPDQDALNKIFYGRSMVLPQKFNYLLHTDVVDDVEEGVWHYSGPRKPWNDTAMPKADRYFYYAQQTPWAQEPRP